MSTLNDLLVEIDKWPDPIHRDDVRELVRRAWGIAIGHGQYSPRMVDDEDDIEPHGLESRLLRLEEALRRKGLSDSEIAQI
ncbi:hypothetical protein [Streptacidiphilus neutrinimicus]|uniref:hypothetical protein n=1 Tax=Streptacidiphilus neutrinimicus TaxID=105420 RepID=UPI0005A8CFF3|nr:hypothetical protein [Streptacidiphilus neutrinimicus]